MENSLLSVILIARRNTSLSILNALNSILNQNYSPIRILVVDANEPNSIYSLGLQEDLAAYPNVEYLQMDELISIVEIRNYILHYVEGEYIAFLSGNDTWDSAKAILQMEQLREEPKAAASCSNGVLIDKRKPHTAVEPLFGYLTYDTSKWIVDNPAKMPAQVIYQTEAVIKAGGFDGRFKNFSDGDMLLRLNKENKVLILPISLCECCIAQDNEAYDRDNLRDCRNILYKYMDFFLVNKSAAQLLYIRMIYLAKINYLWIDLGGYILMYFMKAPGRSVLMLVKKIGLLFRYLSKGLRRSISQLNSAIQIRKNIRWYKRGRFEKANSLAAVKEAEKIKEQPVHFSSARKYNEQKTLEFVLDHNLKNIVIPEYVTVIKKSMFYGCDRLVSVEIPNTVLEISAHAFQNCRSLRQIIFQEGSRLGKIGAYAFAGCSALETLSLPAGIIEIGKGAFMKCCSLKKLQFCYMHKGKEKAGMVYPAAIMKIPRYTFAGCTKLPAVEFGPDSMLEIVENGAFLGCTKLKKVLLTGKVKILGSYAFAYCRELETAVFVQIDALKSMGKCAFMYCQSLAYFQLPTQIESIHVRSFYACSGLKSIKIPGKVLSINHQAFAGCISLTRAVILNGDAAISSKAFDKHTEVQIQENAEKDLFTD